MRLDPKTLHNGKCSIPRKEATDSEFLPKEVMRFETWFPPQRRKMLLGVAEYLIVKKHLHQLYGTLLSDQMDVGTATLDADTYMKQPKVYRKMGATLTFEVTLTAFGLFSHNVKIYYSTDQEGAV